MSSGRVFRPAGGRRAGAPCGNRRARATRCSGRLYACGSPCAARPPRVAPHCTRFYWKVVSRRNCSAKRRPCSNRASLIFRRKRPAGPGTSLCQALDRAPPQPAGKKKWTTPPLPNYCFCALSTYDIGRIPTSLDEVLVGSVDRIRAINTRVVFVLGVNEGRRVPQNLPERGLFLRDRRHRRRLFRRRARAGTCGGRPPFPGTPVCLLCVPPCPRSACMCWPTELGSDRREQAPSYFFRNASADVSRALSVTRDEEGAALARGPRFQDRASAFAALLGDPAHYGSLRGFFEADPGCAGPLARAESMRFLRPG